MHFTVQTFVDVKVRNNRIKERVKIIEKIYHLHRCAFRAKMRKADNIAKHDCDTKL